jgi:hypothetical protein
MGQQDGARQPRHGRRRRRTAGATERARGCELRSGRGGGRGGRSREIKPAAAARSRGDERCRESCLTHSLVPSAHKSSKVWVSWLTRKSPPARQVAPIHSVRAPSAPSFFRTLMILFVQKKKRTPSQSAQQTHLLAPATEFEYHGKSMSHKSSHSRVLSTHRLKQGRSYHPLNAITFFIFRLHLLMNQLLGPWLSSH